MLPTPPSGRPVRLALAALCCAATVIALPASADTLTLSLEDALRLARERSVTLRLVTAELDALRAEASEAALPAKDSQLELSGGPRLGDRDECMIPAVPEMIVRMDVEGRKVVIRPTPGLLDLSS